MFRRQKRNPFYYRQIEVPDEYFCDRKEETETLVNLLLNDNNVVLKAPRRLGKSSLICHVLKQNGLKQYNAVFVDLYPTRSLSDFVSVFGMAVLDCATIGRRGRSQLTVKLKSHAVTTELTIPQILKISDTRSFEEREFSDTLQEIFRFLETTSQPNLIVFDEFQQILDYKEDNVPEILRTFIQRAENTRFVFSGSAQHMLTGMFEEPGKPFFRSSRTLNLTIIPTDRYVEFCCEQFRNARKEISEEAVRLVYDIFSGNTYLMQMTMNQVFQYASSGHITTVDDVKAVINMIIDERADDYRRMLRNMKPNYEKVLLCIANEGIAAEMTSAGVRQKYGLPSPATVTNILKFFLDENQRVISEPGPCLYRLDDRYLELWAAKYIFKALERKFQSAEQMFLLERKAADVF